MPAGSRASSPKSDLRILDAASQLFLQFGVKRTSMDDVARAAGLAKGTLYLYYASKESLFAAVAERLSDDLYENVCRAAEAPGPLAERLAAVFDARYGEWRRTIERSPHVAELLESKHTIAAGIGAAHERRMDAALGKFLLDGGIDAKHTAPMFVAAAIGALHTGSTASAQYRARLTRIIQTLLIGLGART